MEQTTPNEETITKERLINLVTYKEKQFIGARQHVMNVMHLTHRLEARENTEYDDIWVLSNKALGHYLAVKEHLALLQPYLQSDLEEYPRDQIGPVIAAVDNELAEALRSVREACQRFDRHVSEAKAMVKDATKIADAVSMVEAEAERKAQLPADHFPNMA